MSETFNKKEREKKKEQRRKAKQLKKEARKDKPNTGGWENMMAYVDENGMLQDTPIDPKSRQEIKAKNIEIGVPKREHEEKSSFLQGVINHYDAEKGYGFIKTSNEESFFVHHSNITGEPAKGKKVQFEKEKSAKGWVAVKVVII